MKKYRNYYYFAVLLFFLGISIHWGFASQEHTSIFNNCTAEKLEMIPPTSLVKDWFALPIVQNEGMFSPVFLSFKYTCRGGMADPKQSLTFPSLLSFKFDFVPDNYSSRHANFIFRSDPTVLKIDPTDKEGIVQYIDFWKGTHAIAGELIQTDQGYGGSIVVYNGSGHIIFKQEYQPTWPYFTLIGKIVNDWMTFRNQPVSDGLYQELIHPMTKDMDTVRWFGESFDVKRRSQADWDIYEKILKRDPGFGEIQYWYTNEKRWSTDVINQNEYGKALLDHPVISALTYFKPWDCSDKTINENYQKVLSHMVTICPDNPSVIAAYLGVNSKFLTLEQLNSYLPLVQKYPNNYDLLVNLNTEYRDRFIEEKALPLSLTASSSGYLTTTGNFSFEYEREGYEFWELGYLPESWTCNNLGIQNCSAEKRPWLNGNFGFDCQESFNFKQAADYYRARFLTHNKAFRILLYGYLSLYEGGLTKTIKEWEQDPLTAPASSVLQPFINAYEAIASNNYQNAIEALKAVPFSVYQGDKLYQLEAEIIRADALLMAGKRREAKQHVLNAWYIMPRGRRTSYLVEKAFADEKDNLAYFAVITKYLFPEDKYWQDFYNRVHGQSKQNISQNQIWTLYQKLLKAKDQFKGDSCVFWLQQPPFLVEYLCLKMAQIPDSRYQQASIELYLDYAHTMQFLSDYQKVHFRTFFRQLMEFYIETPESMKEKWLQSIENDQRNYIAANMGEDQYNQQNYSKALEFYNQALTGKNDDPLILNHMGTCYFKLKNYDKAIASYLKAQSNQFDMDSIPYNLGNVYHQLGMDISALDAYRQAVSINPDNSSAYFYIGYIYSSEKKYQDAINAYQEAIRCNPNSGNAYNNLGDIYNILKRWNDAAEVLQKAIAVDSGNYLSFSNLGIAYIGLGKYPEAVKVLQKSISLRADFFNAHYQLGIAWLHLNNLDAVKKEIETLRNLKSNLANSLQKELDQKFPPLLSTDKQ
jgi:tetratricopeptide (TPR) repeat protein